MASSMKNTKRDDQKAIEMSLTATTELSSQYQIRPSLNKSFPAASVKDIIVDVLQQILEGKDYSKGYAADWSRQISIDINKRIKDLEVPQYKHIVQVMLMEQTGAGSRYIARCRWDAGCDSQISETYKSNSIICVVAVFSVYCVLSFA